MPSLPPLLLALLAALACARADAAESPPDLPLAAGLQRNIPAEAKRGMMQPPDQGLTRIGGTELRLAPGAQIRDTHNRLVLPASLSQPQLVEYVVDNQGQLFRVWILTAAEAAQSR